MEAISNMTVADLQDIVESQLCVYGNKAVFINPSQEAYPLALFVGEAHLTACLEAHDANIERCSLETIAVALKEHDPQALILSSSDEIQARGFQIGFKADDSDFVEIICASELASAPYVRED